MRLSNEPYIILSASAGTGKDTVIQHLLKNNMAPAQKVITSTTRSPRENDGVMEIDGVDYDFLNIDEFKEQITKGKFLEYAEFNGRFYGTPKQRVQDILNLGKVPISVVEVAGAAKIRKAVQDRMNLISIFLTLDPKEREARLRGRGGMSEEDIHGRIIEAEKEKQFIDQYDLQIENTESLDTARIIAQITGEMISGRSREDIKKILAMYGKVNN